jgi:hypothetical protein
MKICHVVLDYSWFYIFLIRLLIALALKAFPSLLILALSFLERLGSESD